MRVTIIGGGSSAHVLSVLLAGKGHDIILLTRRPKDWNLHLLLETDQGILDGNIIGATDIPHNALKDADMAILCMPVHQYYNALNWIADGLSQNPHCIIGVAYGQAGFDWMVQSFSRENDIKIDNYFAIGLLPWIARTKEYGKVGISYGPKFKNGIACSNDYTFEKLESEILGDFSYNYWGCGAFERVPNFITLTLTVDNQIIHPSRCYGLLHNSDGWNKKEDIPYFYRDFDDFSAEVLKGVDQDFTSLRNKLCFNYSNLKNPYMLDYLSLEHWSYGSHNPDIKASFINSTTLRDIKPPVVEVEGKWMLDVEHRFFKDDLAYGLEIIQWFAQKINVDVPHVCKIIQWYEKNIVPTLKQRIQAATPESYGFKLEESLD